MSLVIGICGGSGSGKTTLADRVVERLDARMGPASATVLSFDSYYRSYADLPVDERAAVNFDHPDSLDGELLSSHLDALRQGSAVATPVYDFARYTRTADIRLVDPSPVVVVEGILLFAFAEVLNRLDLRVFRRCPENVRFERRIRRDVHERGRTERSVSEQLAATVKPMHDRFVEPYASVADVVTDHGEDLAEVSDKVAERVLTLAPVGG